MAGVDIDVADFTYFWHTADAGRAAADDNPGK
jgi:hypothetical protein